MNGHKKQDLRTRVGLLEDAIRALLSAVEYFDSVDGEWCEGILVSPPYHICTFCYDSWERGKDEHHNDWCPIGGARALLVYSDESLLDGPGQSETVGPEQARC